MDGTYKAKVYCSNCDFRAEIDIPKGQTIDEAPCPTCGNLTLVKDQSVDLGGGGFNMNQYY